jgi:hypothetical protein
MITKLSILEKSNSYCRNKGAKSDTIRESPCIRIDKNTGWSRYNLPKKFWVIRRI